MRRLWIAAIFGTLGISAPAEWMAGVAEGKITPPLGTRMAGFAARKGTAAGVHDDLFVRALVVSRGERKIALVTVDVVGVDKSTASRIRDEAGRRTGIPPDHIVISATHTHSGPEVRGGYADILAGTAADTIAQAWNSRRPARIGTDSVAHRGWVGMNRRRLESGFHPVDKRISILKLCDAQGTLQAVLYNYSCHPACLGPDNLQISADWPYFTRRRIQNKLGSQVKVLFFQGTEGNVNTGYSAGLSAIGVPIATRNFAYAEEAGEVLADAILERLPAIKTEADGALDARNQKIELERYIPSTVQEAEAELEQARSVLKRADEQHAPETRIQAARVQATFAEYNLSRVQRNLKLPRQYAAELQAFRIGDAGLLTFPGEFFVEIGLEVKRLSPFRTTFCLGLANDGIGYVPIPQAYSEGGYEPSVAQFGPTTAERWERAAQRLLLDLSR